MGMDAKQIRNFCIIAHIDHGKSTLADRMLEITGTVSDREMVAQVLDSMDLERERGITIKAQAVRMEFSSSSGEVFQFNLIDTPGHVDFSYEVSRSLAACEGAILVVDASQGIQAQTLANVYLAIEHDLTIIPVLNKIDLPAADPERISSELEQAFGFNSDEILRVSAKEGTGVQSLLEAVANRIGPPSARHDVPLRALIFDSKYDPYKGVVAYVRIVDGQVASGDRVRMMATQSVSDILELGAFRPKMEKVPTLSAGEVGYVATGLKSVSQCRVGDTITLMKDGAQNPLPGYGSQKPMVFAGLYPADGTEFHEMREALEKLQLNDAALTFGPENSVALGPGFRCGFLGLLHMEIIQERLEREYRIDLIATAPSVIYQVVLTNGTQAEINRPSDLPSSQETESILEPWLDVSIVTPSRFIGGMMELISDRRGEFRRTEYLVPALEGSNNTDSPSSDPRVLLEAKLPLSEVLVDFYDQMKTKSKGYASLDYDFGSFVPAPLVRLDVLVNETQVDALSLIVHRDRAYRHGKFLVEKLRHAIPRQLFDVPIQAAIGGRIISRETVKALRKNVLAKCYGGDVTRKRKLLEKQAEGKKRMKRVGRVEIPQEAFLAILRSD